MSALPQAPGDPPPSPVLVVTATPDETQAESDTTDLLAEAASDDAKSDAWTPVELVLREHSYNPDLQGARALYASIAAHRLDGQPVWTMVVAPPGSLKTELLEALDGLPLVYLIDQVTPKTFLSGQIKKSKKSSEVSPSLLHRVGSSGILICPDFSTVLSMNRDDRGSVLADVRRIYDGHLRKEFGTSDTLTDREWRGRMTFAAGATPDVGGLYSMFQSLGERFVMVRWSRPGGVGAALKAMKQDRNEAKQALKSAVQLLFAGLPEIRPNVPSDVAVKIAAVAEVAVRGRTHVPRSGYNKEVPYLPEPEASTRLSQQLTQLAKGSALLAGRDTVHSDDLSLARRVAFDCMPATRRKILDALVAKKSLDTLNMPGSTQKYALEDLELQGLVKGRCLSPYAAGTLRQAGIL